MRRRRCCGQRTVGSLENRDEVIDRPLAMSHGAQTANDGAHHSIEKSVALDVEDKAVFILAPASAKHLSHGVVTLLRLSEGGKVVRSA